MNSEQIQSIVRTFLAVLIGPTGYLVTKGLLTPEQATTVLPAVVSIIVIVGGVIIGKWGVSSHSASAVTAAVNSPSVPGVKAVAVTSPGIPVAVDSKGVVSVATPSKGT